MYHLLVISGLFTLALAGDIAFFVHHAHNGVFDSCMYTCMCVCNVYICVHTTPRHIPHNNWTLSGMVGSTNAIFSDNTEQYVMLCCRCQQVKFSRPYSTEGNVRNADPFDVHTATIIILEH